jgi:hypothetical protein
MGTKCVYLFIKQVLSGINRSKNDFATALQSKAKAYSNTLKRLQKRLKMAVK